VIRFLKRIFNPSFVVLCLVIVAVFTVPAGVSSASTTKTCTLSTTVAVRLCTRVRQLRPARAGHVLATMTVRMSDVHARAEVRIRLIARNRAGRVVYNRRQRFTRVTDGTTVRHWVRNLPAGHITAVFYFRDSNGHLSDGRKLSGRVVR